MAENDGELMTPAEVGRAFHVDPKTVTRWAKRRNLSVVFTVGGHRRYLRSEIEELRAPVMRQGADRADET